MMGDIKGEISILATAVDGQPHRRHAGGHQQVTPGCEAPNGLATDHLSQLLVGQLLLAEGAPAQHTQRATAFLQAQILSS